MRPSLALQILRKDPKREGFMGVKWTQWFFPSLVVRAVYRRFFPVPSEMTEAAMQRSERTYGWLTFAYFMSAWTMLGVVIYEMTREPPPKKKVADPNRPEASDDEAYVGLLQKNFMKDRPEHKVYTAKMTGASFGGWQDSTENVRNVQKQLEEEEQRKMKEEQQKSG